ncbi:MAG: hypothetical protein WCQ82_06515 [Bacteroidaceae bacterium]
MKHQHLNTNKQFMIGNAILAFCILLIVVFFLYMSFRYQQKKDGIVPNQGHFQLVMATGFLHKAVSIYINDSLYYNQTIEKDSLHLFMEKRNEENTLLIVDNKTDKLSIFNLEETNIRYIFDRSAANEITLATQPVTLEE